MIEKLKSVQEDNWEEKVKYIEEIMSQEQTVDDFVQQKGEIKEVASEFTKIIV